ncbi:MaoC family dehydratase [Streptomyces sp. NRRL S-340]|uniref:MaoC family dehydratase n=1 Tax=Streptomyces sp. NRRL S-340 TaxID=1463901 RepID=UPI000564170A|nr:MaoC/PaaZ C-terminal domain-containing protein [Streptomyces sp. NRRL S-340]
MTAAGPGGRPTVVLTRAPALAPLLARGALRSPFRRPRPDAPFPRARLVLASVRPDLARLTAYERVCGFATGEDTLPVTYPHVLGFPLAMRLMSGGGFPLPLLGLIHTSIAVTRHTALPAAGTYDIAVRVDGLAAHRRGTQATVVTELRAGGDLVWESASTYLARHRPHTPATGGPGATGAGHGDPGGGRADPAGDGHGDPAGEGRADPAGHGGSSGDGRRAEPFRDGRAPLPAVGEWRLADDLGRRYGAASGDRNPIHLHPLTARLFGFPRPIAHGMWTVARCLAAHGTPEAARVRAAFRAPVPLPGALTYAADGRGRFELRSADATARVHLVGEVEPLRP